MVPAQKPIIIDGSVLPDFLTGIDVEAGVQRLDGKQELYLALLEDFVHDVVHVVEEVRNSLFNDEKEDIQTARRLVHSVRVKAGNLAAMDLHHAASNLEKAIVENRPDDWLDMMEAFTVAFNLVMNSISTMDKVYDSGVANGHHHKIAESGEIEQELNDLALSIKKKRFRAKKQLTAFKIKLGDVANSGTMQFLESSIDKYDFTEAFDHLQALADLLEVSLTNVDK